MSWYEFVFSEKPSHRITRHVIFWLVWAMYFFASYFHYQQVGLQKIQFEVINLPFIVKSLIQLSIHIATCYFFIDYLLPRFLKKVKYITLTLNISAFIIIIVFTGYFIHKTIFPLINNAFNYHPVIPPQNIWWTSVTSYLLTAPKVICLAAAIRLFKRWWLKEKEKEILEKQKLMADLQLLKVQMHPEFLFSSLTSIELLIRKKNIQNAGISLLKLADILSFMLYESDNSYVPLDKEIKCIRDYLVLVKNTMGNRLEVDFAVKANTSEMVIVPLLLFPFIESSFAHMFDKPTRKSWINIEFQVDKNTLIMKIIHGKTEETDAEFNSRDMEKLLKRLNFFYPGQFEIKSTVEPEMMMISLKIMLGREKVEITFTDPIIKNPGYASI
jgi:hypothetical protein